MHQLREPRGASGNRYRCARGCYVADLNAGPNTLAWFASQVPLDDRPISRPVACAAPDLFTAAATPSGRRRRLWVATRCLGPAMA